MKLMSSKNVNSADSLNVKKSLHLTFFRLPTRIQPNQKIELTHTELQNETLVLTNQRSSIPSSLCIKSFGYSSWSDHLLHSFLHLKKTTDVLLPMYFAGWMHTKSKGTIATTMQDAYITADTLLLDFETSIKEKVSKVPTFCSGVTLNEVKQWKPPSSSSFIIDWKAWTQIENVEKTNQSKLLSNEAMLQCITSF